MSDPVTTTLYSVFRCADEKERAKLLAHLDKKEPDHEPLRFSTVVNVVGTEIAYRCLQHLSKRHKPTLFRLSADLVERVFYIAEHCISGTDRLYEELVDVIEKIRNHADDLEELMYIAEYNREVATYLSNEFLFFRGDMKSFNKKQSKVNKSSPEYARYKHMDNVFGAAQAAMDKYCSCGYVSERVIEAKKEYEGWKDERDGFRLINIAPEHTAELQAHGKLLITHLG